MRLYLLVQTADKAMFQVKSEPQDIVVSSDGGRHPSSQV